MGRQLVKVLTFLCLAPTGDEDPLINGVALHFAASIA
jgi:hypothetical protein